MTTAVYEFLERVYGYKLNVPLGIGAKCGTRWGDKQAAERTFQLEGSTLYEIVKGSNGKEKVEASHQGAGACLVAKQGKDQVH
jgi:hypothetical protein